MYALFLDNKCPLFSVWVVANGTSFYHNDDYNMMTRAGNEATEEAVGSSVRFAVAFAPKNLHIRVSPEHPKVSQGW